MIWERPSILPPGSDPSHENHRDVRHERVRLTTPVLRRSLQAASGATLATLFSPAAAGQRLAQRNGFDARRPVADSRFWSTGPVAGSALADVGGAVLVESIAGVFLVARTGERVLGSRRGCSHQSCTITARTATSTVSVPRVALQPQRSGRTRPAWRHCVVSPRPHGRRREDRARHSRTGNRNVTTHSEMDHLLRRAGFGVSPADAETFRDMSTSAAIAHLVTTKADRTTSDARIGRPDHAQVATKDLFAPDIDIDDARQRWMFPWIHTRRPLQEKMALFGTTTLTPPTASWSPTLATSRQPNARAQSWRSARATRTDRALPQYATRQLS